MHTIFVGTPAAFANRAARRIVSNRALWMLADSDAVLEVLARLPARNAPALFSRLGNTPFPVPLNPLQAFSAEALEVWIHRILPMSDTVRRALFQALATSDTLPEAILSLRTSRLARGKRAAEETAWPELAAEIRLRQCFGGALYWHTVQRDFGLDSKKAAVLDVTTLSPEEFRMVGAMALSERTREVWLEFRDGVEPLGLVCRMIAGGADVVLRVPSLTDFFWWAREEGVAASDLRQMDVTVLGGCTAKESLAAREVGWTVRPLQWDTPSFVTEASLWWQVIETMEAKCGTPILEISRNVAGWGG